MTKAIWQILTLLILLRAPVLAQAQLEFAPLPGSYNRVLLLPNGNRVFVGTVEAYWILNPSIKVSHIALSVTGPAPYGPFPVLGGSGNDIPSDAAVDGNGNLWIVGSTDSDDFRVVNPVYAHKEAYRTAGFLIELDPTGTSVLFSTYLGGQFASRTLSYDGSCYTAASAIAVGRDGSIYVGVSSDEPGPVAPSCANNFGETNGTASVWKFSPSGKLLSSVPLGGRSLPCTGGSACVGKGTTTGVVGSLAIDANGDVYASVMEGAGGYIARIALAASAPDLIPVGRKYPRVVGLRLALGGNGAVSVFGVYQTTAPATGLGVPYYYNPGLFAERYAAGGTTAVYAIDFGQANDSNAAGILVDAAGDAWIAGTSSSATFPSLAGIPNLGSDFLLRLDSTGTMRKLFRFPAGVVTAPPLFEGDGRIDIPGSQGALLRNFPADYAFDLPIVVGFANSASYRMATGLSPGTLVTLFGFGLGAPAGKMQVSMNGAPAPVLFAGENQINVQTPFETVGPKVDVKVTIPSGVVGFQSYNEAFPMGPQTGIFTTDGTHAAALNEDGTVNSQANPAPEGSIVSLFGTGATWRAPMTTGAIAEGIVRLGDTVSATDASGNGISIIYAGSAPGLIEGVFQLNLQLPVNFQNPVTVRVGVSRSNPVQIYVK